MEITALRRRLDELGRITDAEWMASLSDRKRKELDFHDRDRDRKLAGGLDADQFERFYGNKKYYRATRDSQEYVATWLRTHAPGKVFLDYACGNGQYAIRAAREGAALAIGIDISSVSVANARADAAAAGVGDRTCFVQADAENTRLPDAAVDVIVCSGMLHHLDLSYAFPELRRILAPGGRLLAIEALAYNPAIALYRKLTPAMRTEWERQHILGLEDLRFAQRFFDIGEVRYWHLVSILAGKVPPLLRPLEALDRVLTRLPLVQLMSWIFTFELVRNADGNGA